MRIQLRTKYIMLFAFVTIYLQTQAQTHSKKEYARKPLWIEMMNDSSANYFETIKAFREFWKGRVLPEEPFENESIDTFEKEVGLKENDESPRERMREKRKREKYNPKNEINYGAQVRAFKGWLHSVKPWVREDGSIISVYEQQQIINQQQQELK
jgi:hypothetical protein